VLKVLGGRKDRGLGEWQLKVVDLFLKSEKYPKVD
jgi:hypothetical protein